MVVAPAAVAWESVMLLPPQVQTLAGVTRVAGGISGVDFRWSPSCAYRRDKRGGGERGGGGLWERSGWTPQTERETVLWGWVGLGWWVGRLHYEGVDGGGSGGGGMWRRVFPESDGDHVLGLHRLGNGRCYRDVHPLPGVGGDRYSTTHPGEGDVPGRVVVSDALIPAMNVWVSGWTTAWHSG